MDPATVAEDGFGYVVLVPGEVGETRPEVILTHSPTPMPELGSASRIRFGPQIDGPVTMVRAWFAARGRERFGPLWLAGGVTLPAVRGRGIYRALVRARRDDAVRLGAGALIVIANVETSYPILERRGFRAAGRVRLLVDRS